MLLKTAEGTLPIQAGGGPRGEDAMNGAGSDPCRRARVAPRLLQRNPPPTQQIS